MGSLPEMAIAQELRAAEIKKIAENITVFINKYSDGNRRPLFAGSGVMLASSGANTYQVLTAKHVMITGEAWEVITPDGQSHKVDRVDLLPGELDLAVFQFQSDRNYRGHLTCIGNSDNLAPGSRVYLSGWVKSERSPRFSSGEIIFNRERAERHRGYNLIYSNEAHNGMSGGPLLDANGCVVGTHGRRGQNPNRYQGIPIDKAIAVLEEKINLDTGEEDNFRQGIMAARQARRLWQSAREANQTPDRRKIAEYLRRAIGFMEAVPSDHRQYQDARNRIDRYRQWLDKIENSRSNEQYHL